MLDPEGFAAAVDPIGFAGALGEAAKALARHPLPVARAASALAASSSRATLAAVQRGLGGHSAGPATVPDKDRRYADPAWEGNALYYLLRQEHTLFSEQLQAVASGLELSPTARRKIDFLVQQAVAATAPVNFPWSNPTMLTKALQTGGLSLVRGARNALRDAVTNKGLPRQTTPGQFVPGRDLATTPGTVVYRNRLIELIQYAPQTETVHATPLLLSPPWINKYYIMDLAPGKSLVEWAVAHGHTVFMISYRNPDESLRDVTMSDYLREGPLAALDVVQEITGAPQVNVAGLCLGGTLATAAAAWSAARNDGRIGSITLMNTLLDFTEPGLLGVFIDDKTVGRLERSMRRTGYLPAESMKTTFDMLRPSDLLWNYVINDWLLGEDPAAFDILSWNADSTRMPAAMQAEYLRTCYQENQLAEGKMELAGERLDLAAVRQDAYVISAEADHIAPWRSSYQGATHLGGDVRFVLSNSGHIAGVVNPPSSKSRHWTGPVGALGADSQRWRDDAAEHRTSWWEDWTPWIAERAGEQVPARAIGSAAHPGLQDAPGSYVLGS
ncbi:PHA/PHB synthase family protein [Pseudonocardia sp. GCM10023141]|uniref:PHA/PHB synthase family protein n=1 Tax=Pseudonocardia sp. GCM10023141 TaxID=3252653 RepID=UPI00360D512D